MPRRSLLSAAERATLLAMPEGRDDIIRHYTLGEPDLSLIRQHRGDANRLGFAVQLCLLRYPGYAMGGKTAVPEPVIQWIASQIQADASAWAEYWVHPNKGTKSAIESFPNHCYNKHHLVLALPEINAVFNV
jgi:TnpA family transposase